MRYSTAFLALAAGVAVVSAQVGNNSCVSTSTLPGTITVTDLVTSTYCPVCDAAKATGGVYTTVYETVYAAVCPTGMTSSTYTVTQTCTGSERINPATLPPQFTAVATVCTACPGQPTLTVTEPCDCTPTPGAQSPGGGHVVTPGGANPVVTPGGSNPVVTPGAANPAGSPGATPGTGSSGESPAQGSPVVTLAVNPVGATTKPAASQPALFTGAASILSFSGFAAMLSVGSAFLGMLLL